QSELWLTATADGAHGAYVTWTERDVAGTSRLFAQRLGPDGTALWPLPGPVLATSTYATPSQLVLCPSGSSSVIAAWKQVELADGVTLDARRLDAAGSALWAAGGVALSHPTHEPYPCCPNNGDLFDVHVASDGLGGALLSHAEYKLQGPATYNFVPDIPAARITQAGAAPSGQ